LAARHIETFESDRQHPRRPRRVSRLSRIHDISTEIQRDNTPVPDTFKLEAVPEIHPTPEPVKENQGNRSLPEFWPWIHDADTEVMDESDWKNQEDPLASRHIPRRSSGALVEAEDMWRILGGRVKIPLRRSIFRSPMTIRNIFVGLLVLAVIGLIIDSVLLSFTFFYPQKGNESASGPPVLLISSSTTHIGQSLIIHLQHFPALTQVLLTRDIQDVLYTDGKVLKKVTVGSNGSVDVTIQVDASWSAGFHTILAEDLANRYTASSIVQLIDPRPSKPSHLLVDIHQLDMGEDFQGASTIKTVDLHNTGGGSVTWSASSDQPWLFLSPASGTFSTDQHVSIAVSRNNLKSTVYHGHISFTSNLGGSAKVDVQMSVKSLPLNPGPVLSVSPPLLSFSSTDGGMAPVPQNLTISNPGSKKLKWSLTGTTPLNNPLLASLGNMPQWLSLRPASGEIDPGSTQVVQVIINNTGVIAGTFTDKLTFTGLDNAVNNPQYVNVTYTVLPSCSLATNADSLSFTSVAGLSTTSSQSLGLSALQSCGSTISWHSVTSNASWLTVSPTNGQLKSGESTNIAVWVNSANLSPKIYQGYVSIVTAKNTQSVPIILMVQPKPSPSTPIATVSPLTLNFSAVQGQADPPAQVASLVNSGGGSLYWHANATFSSSTANSWMAFSPGNGLVAPGQSGQITVKLHTGGMTPGSYSAQLVIVGMDGQGQTASGSPQIIAVHLTVVAPCTLSQASSSSLAFTATQGAGNPTSQTITTTAAGNCSWPLNWKATVDIGGSWLNVTQGIGSISAGGQGATLTITPNIIGLTPGTYTGHLSINATDQSANHPEGSPVGTSVTLTVLPPCIFQANTASLAFSIGQGQPSPAGQNVGLSETGHCAYPASWTASVNAASNNWLQLSATSGNDAGAGSTLAVNVNSGLLTPGTYTGQITIMASGSGATPVLNNPIVVSVTFTVTAYSLSGTAMGCSDTTCATTASLPGATVALNNSSGTQITSVTADASGNFSFNGVALGSYTIVVSGTDSGNHPFTGSTSVVVTGNQNGLVADAYPG
ncbi:MAG TPA: carboxypeptidase regulatory-like domain-containing protein, partial [Ktedonobacteraceae bacterium]|nr:carboxypeptidase regulatory-like domain-containing protein [Ktedonobacteraceae bacterium]